MSRTVRQRRFVVDSVSVRQCNVTETVTLRSGDMIRKYGVRSC
jgi:hypothetical protein